jgi:hypothetical protein
LEYSAIITVPNHYHGPNILIKVTDSVGFTGGWPIKSILLF